MRITPECSVTQHGWLYVTERTFAYATGFGFRLRRFKWREGEADPSAEETLIELAPETGIDNIEAVSVCEHEGETLILVASDDNHFVLQRNVLALFALR